MFLLVIENCGDGVFIAYRYKGREFIEKTEYSVDMFESLTSHKKTLTHFRKNGGIQDEV